ncbi:MAG TPA: response regulator transcription factor [Dehalococcoidia bacterium]
MGNVQVRRPAAAGGAAGAGQAPLPIRIAIVEDEDLYRDLLRAALEGQDRLAVVGAFPSAEAALEAWPALDAAVAVLDIELGGGINGIQLAAALRREQPELGIVFLSNYLDIEYARSLSQEMAAGWSYLLKRSVRDVQTLVRAVEGAASGLVVIDSEIFNGVRERPEGPLSQLTERQRQILDLVASGYTNATIARRLYVSEKTVENQLNMIYGRLGVDREDRSIHPRVKAALLYLQAAGDLGPEDQGSRAARRLS